MDGKEREGAGVRTGPSSEKAKRARMWDDSWIMADGFKAWGSERALGQRPQPANLAAPAPAAATALRRALPSRD